MLSFFSREPDAAARNSPAASAPLAEVRSCSVSGACRPSLDKQRREDLGADAVVARSRRRGAHSPLGKGRGGCRVEVVAGPAGGPRLRNETLRGVKLEDPDLRE